MQNKSERNGTKNHFRNFIIACILGWMFATNRDGRKHGIKLLCIDISPDETYIWYSGIWHGIFFLPNWMWNGFNDDILYKANYYTPAYNFWWWFFSIVTTLLIVWLYNIPKTIKMIIEIIMEKFQ